MKVIIILFSSLLLNGCFLFIHECGSLSGWCTSSSSPSFYEYDYWVTPKELENLKDHFTLTLTQRERMIERN